MIKLKVEVLKWKRLKDRRPVLYFCQKKKKQTNIFSGNFVKKPKFMYLNAHIPTALPPSLSTYQFCKNPQRLSLSLSLQKSQRSLSPHSLLSRPHHRFSLSTRQVLSLSLVRSSFFLSLGKINLSLSLSLSLAVDLGFPIWVLFWGWIWTLLFYSHVLFWLFFCITSCYNYSVAFDRSFSLSLSRSWYGFSYLGFVFQMNWTLLYYFHVLFWLIFCIETCITIRWLLNWWAKILKTLMCALLFIWVLIYGLFWTFCGLVGLFENGIGGFKRLYVCYFMEN